MWSQQMRVQAPREFSEVEIAVTANTFFLHFANDLGAFINEFMTQKHGPAWFQDLRNGNALYRNFNLRDPAALLKDLTRNGASPFRQAIHSKVERGFQREFYDDLDGLLGDRHTWYHRSIPETTEALLDLITSMVRSSQKLGLAVAEDCLHIQSVIYNPEEPAVAEDPGIKTPDPAVPTESLSVGNHEVTSIETESIQELAAVISDSNETATPAEIVDIAGVETSNIGDEVVGNLLSHSYVLHTTGEIRNRLSGELLSALNPQSARTLGSFLLARKPTGGRMRITEEGVLCAFFEDQWGYLARVKPEDWFPDHLHSTQGKK